MLKPPQAFDRLLRYQTPGSSTLLLFHKCPDPSHGFAGNLERMAEQGQERRRVQTIGLMKVKLRLPDSQPRFVGTEEFESFVLLLKCMFDHLVHQQNPG